ncbi:MAG: type III secretion system chaperone [Pseudomonadota bacterium]
MSHLPRMSVVLARFLLPLCLLPGLALAQDDTAPDPLPAPAPDTQAEAPMTLDRLSEIIQAIDPEAQSNGTIWQLSINGLTVLIITDASNDRMRAMAPVRETADLTPEELTRMMQANFDTALDARYAIARDVVWATFIHPLRPLEKDQLISGLGQVVNLAQSYGTLYSGGAMQFGGGDSGALQRALIEELLKKGEEI